MQVLFTLILASCSTGQHVLCWSPQTCRTYKCRFLEVISHFIPTVTYFHNFGSQEAYLYSATNEVSHRQQCVF